MDIKEFKKYTNNLDKYTAEEVNEFELMTDEELDSYQHELETDGGNLSNWDNLRAFITLKKMVIDSRLSYTKESVFGSRTRDWFDINDI